MAAGLPEIPYGSMGSIWSEIGLDYGQFMKGAEQVKKETTALENITKQSLENMTRDWGKYGSILSISVTAPLVAMGRQMQQTYAGFEQGMARTAAVSQATHAELQGLTATARELGATTQFTARQAADGMTFLAMAGFEANEVIGAMPGVLQLAAAASLDLATAADITTNILTGYAMRVEDLGRVNDVLTAAMTGANTNLQQLGEAMKYAGPVATAAGIQFEEAAAAISLMGNAGIQGSMAGTSLRNAISRLLNPTAEVTRTLRNLGVEVTDSSGRLLSVTEIIEQLERRGASAGDMLVLFGQRAGPAMQALVEQGSDALDGFIGRLEESGGMAERIAKQQMDTLHGSQLELKSAWDELSIALMQNVAPGLRTVYDAGADLLRWLAQLPPEVQTGTVAVLAMTAALGPLMLAIRGVVATLGLLVTPAGAFAAVAMGLTYLGVSMATNAREQRELQRASLDTARALDGEARELDDLVRAFDRLQGKPDKSKEEHDELERVMNRIAELQPDLVAGYDDLGEAILNNLDPLRDYVKMLREMSDIELEVAAIRAQITVATIEPQLAEEYLRLEGLREQQTDAFAEGIKRMQEFAEAQRLYSRLQLDRELGRPDEESLQALQEYLNDVVGGVSFGNFQGAYDALKREAKAYEDMFGQRAKTIQGTLEKIREYEDELKRSQAILDAFTIRQSGGDPFPIIDSSSPTRPSVAKDDEGVGDDADDLEQVVQQESALWQARISLVRAGVTEFIREYGTLKNATQSYYDWLSEQVERTDLGDAVRGSLADALMSLKDDLDALEHYLPTQIELEALMPSTAIQVDIKGADGMAWYPSDLSDEMRKQWLESLGIEDGDVVRAFERDLMRTYGEAADTLWRELGAIIGQTSEAGLPPGFDIMYTNLDEFRTRVDNYWEHLVASGQVGTQELVDVVTHQLRQLPDMSTGSDEWLELTLERSALLSRLSAERRQEMLQELELRAAIAEEEGELVEAELLREEARHQGLVTTLQAGTEAYELEIERHGLAVVNIQEAALRRQRELLERALADMARSRATEEERELERIRETADEYLAAGVSEVQVTEWAEQQKAQIRRRYQLLRQSDEEQMAAQLAQLAGESLAATLHEIESGRLAALATATSQDAVNAIETLVDAQRQAAYQAFVDQAFQDMLAELNLEARRSEWTLTQVSEAYSHALRSANSLYEGVTVSAGLAAEAEVRALEIARQAQTESFDTLVRNIERRAEMERWSSGRLAQTLEQEALMYARTTREKEDLEHRIWRLRDEQRQKDEQAEEEWTRFLIDSGRMQARVLLQEQLDAARERLRVARETGEGIVEAERAVQIATHNLNVQLLDDMRARYDAMAELGTMDTTERLGMLGDMIAQRRALLGATAAQDAELRWLLLEWSRVYRVYLTETADADIRRIRSSGDTLRALAAQREHLVQLIEAWADYGDEGEDALKRILDALDDVDRKTDETLRRHPLMIAVDELESMLRGDQDFGDTVVSTALSFAHAEIRSLIDDTRDRVAHFIMLSVDGSHDFGAAWTKAFSDMQISAKDAVALVLVEIINLFRATSDARRRLVERAKMDVDARIENEKEFARLVGAGFVGEFETVTQRYVERVSYLFGLVHENVWHSEQVTAESTREWIERMAELFDELQGVGRNAMSEAFRFAPGHEMPIFMRSLRAGIYDSVVSGFLDAFVDHEIYTRAMAPLFQAIDQAMEESFSGDSFDADRWWAIVGPALDAWQDSMDDLESPLSGVRRVLAELQEELGLPFIPDTEPTGGTRLTQFTGEQRDLFVELLRPVKALDRLPGYHDAYLVRLDRLVELMEADSGSDLAAEFERYLNQESAIFHATTITVEHIVSATFTGPSTVVIGDENARRIIEKILDDLDDDGDAAARGYGLD